MKVEELGIKQRMGEIPATAKHPRLEVFTSGKPGCYVFCPMVSGGIGKPSISGTIHIPVQGKDLKRGWKRLLE